MVEADREFQIFVKPVGAVCNLGCSYCYYLEKKSLYPEKSDFLMSDEILEIYVIQHISATTEKLITFSWHGGEPLLAGIDFYKKAVKLQKHYRPSGSKIVNGMQTNATLLNDEWCRFLSEENFTVGISIDGPAEFHNRFRVTRDGKKSFDKVVKGFKLLKTYGVLPEILCVVNTENVDHPKDIYNFFKSLEVKYIAFLPLVEKHPESSSGVTEKSVPAEKFGLVKSQSLPQYCLNCEVLSMCNGECPKNRFISSPDNEPGLNYLCPGYKLFFNH